MKKFSVLLMLVIFTVCLPSIARAIGPNILDNPGFEEPNGSDPTRPESWLRAGIAGLYINDPAVAHDGNDCVRLSTPGGVGWAVWYQVRAEPPVDINQGALYYFQTYAKDPCQGIPGVAWGHAKFEFYDSPGDTYPPALGIQKIYFLAEYEWALEQGFAAVPLGCQRIHASLCIDYAYPGGATGHSMTVLFDDVSMFDAGQPSPCQMSKLNAQQAIGWWPPLPGDINLNEDGTVGDCYVNMADLERWVESWLWSI